MENPALLSKNSQLFFEKQSVVFLSSQKQQIVFQEQLIDFVLQHPFS